VRDLIFLLMIAGLFALTRALAEGLEYVMGPKDTRK